MPATNFTPKSARDEAKRPIVNVDNHFGIGGTKLIEDILKCGFQNLVDAFLEGVTLPINITVGNGLPIDPGIILGDMYIDYNGGVYIWDGLIWNPISGGLGGYDTVEDEGVALIQRSTIDFVGAGVTATDNGSKTVVTIPSRGDVVGPASATDNAIARYDALTGKLIQNSSVTISDLSANSVTITPPNVAGTATRMTISGGQSTTGPAVGGDMTLRGGTGNGAQGGLAFILGGTGGTNSNGGNALVSGGNGSGTGIGGHVILRGQEDSVQSVMIQTLHSGGNHIEYNIHQARVETTDATVTTLRNMPIDTNSITFIEATIVARRTGGIAGAVGDGATYIIRAAYKDIAGVVTLMGAIDTVFIREDQAGWDATFTINGSSIDIDVTGAVDNDISRNLSKGDITVVSL